MKAKVTFLVLFFLVVSLSAEGYKSPAGDIADMVDALELPEALPSPQGNYLVLLSYEKMPPLERLAQGHLKLAGLRLQAADNARQRITYITEMEIIDLRTLKKTKVLLPEGIRCGRPQWSYNEKHLAFAGRGPDGTRLYLVERENGQVKPVPGFMLNGIFHDGFNWLHSGESLLVFSIPGERESAPEKDSVPRGPVIQESGGRAAPARTYQDLLQNPREEELFAYYARTSLLEVSPLTGTVSKIGPEGWLLDAEMSPDGRFILIHRMEKPFSYNVPYYLFPQRIEVWDRQGHLVHLLADLPLADGIPNRGVRTGPRQVSWRPFRPAELVWLEALDQGNPQIAAEHRDRLMSLAAPFSAEPRELLLFKNRCQALYWGNPAGRLLAVEMDWRSSLMTARLADNVDDQKHPVRELYQLNIRDDYNNPGRPLLRETDQGESVLFQDGDLMYFSGIRSSPLGDRPFLESFHLGSFTRRKLFESGKTDFETFVAFAGTGGLRFVSRRESALDPPNYFLRRLNSSRRQELTAYPDPTPLLRRVKKELISYRRADGVELSGTLYLPPDFVAGRPVPAVIWAYPLEYSDDSVAGQVRGSSRRFTRLRGASHLYLLTRGYAVLDNAQMPVVGDPETMNDSFIEQIVAGAAAAVEKLVEMGVADRARVGVGGHSYGAFMTANLLAHSDLFAAGVARSGAYNRTLTPFGFQSERRSLWEAPQVYTAISPFMHSSKLKTPILLIHGEDDNNSGTFPMQSQRFFQALQGHGAVARLVMLPLEGHGYQARESILHVIQETMEWFDRFLKFSRE